jgi:hypothetical protein
MSPTISKNEFWSKSLRRIKLAATQGKHPGGSKINEHLTLRPLGGKIISNRMCDDGDTPETRP